MINGNDEIVIANRDFSQEECWVGSPDATRPQRKLVSRMDGDSKVRLSNGPLPPLDMSAEGFAFTTLHQPTLCVPSRNFHVLDAELVMPRRDEFISKSGIEPRKVDRFTVEDDDFISILKLSEEICQGFHWNILY